MEMRKCPRQLGHPQIELKQIDYLGSFESDDETGTIFEQIKTIIKQLDKFKGEQE